MAYNRKMTGSSICYECGDPFFDDEKKLLIHKDMQHPRMFHKSCADMLLNESGKWSVYETKNN